MIKPTSDILKRINKNSMDYKDGIYTRLYRYLLREDVYYSAYQKLYSNKGACTKGTDSNTADGFGKNYINKLIQELAEKKYKPKPVRREYIKKPNGKMRPLGIPSFRDKLLQEVVKNFLEAIYEPIFSNCSHGFRPKRSCHTAINQIKHEFVGIKWFIEGDIKGCFDDINHDKLIEILERKIKDSKFINIIREFLKAGYVEDWKYHNTYSGTPQGGVLSPILANIYLNELDIKVMDMKSKFDKLAVRKDTPEYRKLQIDALTISRKLKKASDVGKLSLLSDLRKIQNLKLKTPAKSQTDKKIVYIRYADDFLIGVNGNKEECEQIKKHLTGFLQNEYKLTLSTDKTVIAHSSKNARFLGFDISVRRNQEVFTDKLGRKIRKLNGKINIAVPFEKIERYMFEKGIIRQTKSNTFRPLHRKGWLYLSDCEIVERYNAEIRGILNYYFPAANFYKLKYFAYLMEYSCLATIAGKHESSISKTITKHKRGKDWTIQYKTSKGVTKEKRIVKMADYKDKTSVICKDTFVTHKWSVNANSSIKARLQTGICELCGRMDNVDCEVHHVPKVKDLNGNEIWEQVMKSKNRKTLVVCKDCHLAIHGK